MLPCHTRTNGLIITNNNIFMPTRTSIQWIGGTMSIGYRINHQIKGAILKIYVLYKEKCRWKHDQRRQQQQQQQNNKISQQNSGTGYETESKRTRTQRLDNGFRKKYKSSLNYRSVSSSNVWERVLLYSGSFSAIHFDSMFTCLFLDFFYSFFGLECHTETNQSRRLILFV